MDEIHIIDGDGILVYSSVPKYIGMDFHGGEQTGEFLSILDSEDENAYVIQEAQPNTAEGKIMVKSEDDQEPGACRLFVRPEHLFVFDREGKRTGMSEAILARLPRV